MKTERLWPLVPRRNGDELRGEGYERFRNESGSQKDVNPVIPFPRRENNSNSGVYGTRGTYVRATGNARFDKLGCFDTRLSVFEIDIFWIRTCSVSKMIRMIQGYECYLFNIFYSYREIRNCFNSERNVVCYPHHFIFDASDMFVDLEVRLCRCAVYLTLFVLYFLVDKIE